jgi:hypothetical protein
MCTAFSFSGPITRGSAFFWYPVCNFVQPALLQTLSHCLLASHLWRSKHGWEAMLATSFVCGTVQQEPAALWNVSRCTAIRLALGWEFLLGCRLCHFEQVYLAWRLYGSFFSVCDIGQGCSCSEAVRTSRPHPACVLIDLWSYTSFRQQYCTAFVMKNRHSHYPSWCLCCDKTMAQHVYLRCRKLGLDCIHMHATRRMVCMYVCIYVCTMSLDRKDMQTGPCCVFVYVCVCAFTTVCKTWKEGS